MLADSVTGDLTLPMSVSGEGLLIQVFQWPSGCPAAPGWISLVPLPSKGAWEPAG